MSDPEIHETPGPTSPDAGEHIAPAVLLYGLDDKPPFVASAFVGFQHLLAIFGGILTAPLLIALGMGLNTADTTYLISSAFVVSGFATLVQIHRFGMLGAGLLSIQGTSFAFIGPLIFAYQSLVLDMSSEQALGIIFGSSAVCAAIMMGLSMFVRQLKDVITTNVAGATILLLGISLVHTTLNNLVRDFDQVGGLEGEGLSHMLLAAVVFVVIVVISNLQNPWVRLSGISIGLAVGIAASYAMGMLDLSGLGNSDLLFFPELFRFPIGVDLEVMLLIMPIFLVSAMESIGDITATNNLSGLRTGTPDYWQRMRGGILAGGVNSLVASIFCTFPNTTFSQNNGVIRLTGVASRHVGIYVAVFLVVLGCLPVIAELFQRIPSVVIYGATLLMFFLVGWSGFKIVQLSAPVMRDWAVVGIAILLGYAMSLSVGQMTFLSPEVAMILQFPVSTGAMFAVILEWIIPGRVRDLHANA